MGVSVDNPNLFYFTELTPSQQSVYKDLFIGLASFEDTIKFQYIPIDEMSKILRYLKLDNPLLFYAETFTQHFTESNGYCTIKLKYKYERLFVKQIINEAYAFLKCFDSIKNHKDIDKELFIHDYFLKNFTYDYSFGGDAYSILGIIRNKKAVCEGIAKTVKMVFDYVGIRSLVVSGDARDPNTRVHEGHAWNIVVINGKTYHLDVTFDMTLKTSANRYDYFNLSDQQIKNDHIIPNEVPKCVSVDGDYFAINSMLLNSFTELEQYIKGKLNEGKKKIQFKLDRACDSKDVVEKIISLAKKQYRIAYITSNFLGFMVEVSSNIDQMVFEIEFK